MSLVQAKCENCGGLLKVDSNLKAANCPNCGAAYVVQDAINNYNSVTNIDKIHADVLIINDDSSAEARIKAADAHLKMNSYKEAEKEYQRATELTPQDYRGWWGLVQCGIANRKEENNTPSISTLNKYVAYVEKFAPTNIRERLLTEWMSYVDEEEKKRRIRDVLNPKRNDLYSRKQIKNIDLSSVNRRLELLNQDVSGTSEEARKYAFAKKYKKFSKTITIIFIVFLVVCTLIGQFRKFGAFAFLGGMFCFVGLPIHIALTAFILQDYKGIIKRFESSDINNEMNQLEQEKDDIISEIDELDRKIALIESEIKEIKNTGAY